jgi:hypothetical protein
MDHKTYRDLEQQWAQRLLLLKLRLKHKFTLVEFTSLDEINEEIAELTRLTYWSEL